MSRFLSWFTTKKGKIFTRSCVGVAAGLAFCNHIAINGPFLEKIKNIVQVYDIKGAPKPLPTKVNELVEQVLKDSNLKEEDKKKLGFFYVVGHDMFHIGGIKSPWGALVGIPFTFENVEDINFGDLRIAGKESLDWILEGQDLVTAFRISDSAKKFALMREIYSCDFSRVLQNASINGACILLIGRAIQLINQRLNAFERFTFRGRLLYYAIFYCAGFMFYRCIKDPVKHLSDMEADKRASETSMEYLNGGIEYYNKNLMKNKALREVGGSQFEKKFDLKGNENYFIFAPRLPTAKRLENLQQIKKNIIAKET